MGNRGILLSDLPPHIREIAEKQLRDQEQNRSASERYGVASTPLTPSGSPDTTKGKKRGKKRREMNATEREFSFFLLRRVKEGEFSRVDYEGMTLRWGEGAGMMTYTPDFVAVSGTPIGLLAITFFEIKGAHAWKQDIVKFKAARAQFPLFAFQLWEKDGEWRNTI